MSLSSEVTVISPSNALVRTRSHTHVTHHAREKIAAHGHARKTSGHGLQMTHKRRAPHGAAATATPGVMPRRSSESDQRRAMNAGLAMHALDSNAPPGKRKGSQDRPTPKSSKSDTNLVRLSRQTSNVSVASNRSTASASRPKLGKNRKHSGDSVVILQSDENGEEGEVIDGDEEGWEEDEEVKVDGGPEPVRRTVSDTAAVDNTKPQPSAQVDGPVTRSEDSPLAQTSALPPAAPQLHTRKTTGFAGHVSVPDPTVIAPPHPFVAAPPAPEPEPPIHRQRSVKELAQAAVDTERQRVMSRAEHLRMEDQPGRMPERSHSTVGSGLPHPVNSKAQPGATDFPFPDMNTQTAGSSKPQQLERRTRVTSDRPHSQLRQKPSSSSLRSMQSLRAPPHPLNSSMSSKAAPAVVTTSRPGSMFGSPTKGKQAQTLNQVHPVAPPVIYREVAQGHSWDIPEEQESAPAADPSINRRDSHASFSSVHLRSLINGSSSDASKSSSPHPSLGPRRITALQAASAASKLHTTTDPALYHQSLGYPSTSAETAHLISRFLPPKKIKRPAWEIPANSPEMRIGLQNGEYREAHESLVRSMREMGQPSSNSASRRISRNVSLASLATTDEGAAGSSVGSDGVGIGVVRGKGGNFVVARGGWRGKTPFELSVERCLAQKPQRSVSPLSVF